MKFVILILIILTGCASLSDRPKCRNQVQELSTHFGMNCK